MTLGLRDLAFLGGGAPAVPWTPAQLGASLRVWLDADDASTITLNGANVSQWRDKSGLGNHYNQNTAINQMKYTAGAVNGRAVVEADLAGECMRGPNLSMNGSGMSAVVVTQYAGSAGTSITRIWFRNNSVWVGSWFKNWLGTFTNRLISCIFGNGTSWALDGTSTKTMGIGVTRLIGTTVTSGGNTFTYVDGALESTLSQSFANFTGEVQLNHVGGSSQTHLGPICEAFLMIDVLSQSDREKLEGYLAHKWWGAGGANPLPANHPFKATAPTV